MKIRIVFLVLVCGLIGCKSGNSNDEKILKEAASVHIEMVKAASNLKNQLQTLKTNPGEGLSLDSLASWEQSLQEWESDLVEVPGNEDHEDHLHGEGHHHHHHEELNVTAEQMLAIQLSLQEQLRAIQSRVDNGRN